jgi:hypothetical protein
MCSRPPRISGTSVCLQDMHCICIETEPSWGCDDFRRFEAVGLDGGRATLSGFFDVEESVFRDDVVRFARVVLVDPDLRAFRL